MLHRLRIRAGDGQRGSIPMALLVVIIMGWLLTALLSRTVAEGRSTRFDNEYTTTVHAAEVGLEDALYRLNNQLLVTATGAGSGEVDGYGYDWSAVREVDRSWRITSSGDGPNGVRRTITAAAKDNPIFELALATHLGINFGGGNTADSYNSAPQQRCSTPPGYLPNNACYGIIASNGNIDMGSSGQTNNYADRVHVHDMGNPLNNGAIRCGPSSSQYCFAPWRRDFPDPLDIRGDVGLVQALVDSCPSFGEWRASTYATGSGQNRAAVLQASQVPNGTVSINGRQRTVLCASTLHFDVNTTMPTTLTPNNGHIVVVRDRIQIDGAVRVNCSHCLGSFPANPNMPKARLLQIFTLAQDQGSGNNMVAAVQVRQHAKIGAAIYAPDASCGNQQSNAQVEVYGSLICAALLNQGGWNFHYDEDLINGLSSEQYVVTRWTEE